MSHHTPIATKHTDPSEWKGNHPYRFDARLAPEPVIGAGLRGQADALRAAMKPRTLELVALAVCAETGCLYGWHGHCAICIGNELLTREEIAAVAVGPSALRGHDALVVRAVHELLADGRLSEATFGALGHEELGVTAATATYIGVALLMDAIEPEPGMPGVPGLEDPTRASTTHAALMRANTHADHPEAA